MTETRPAEPNPDSLFKEPDVKLELKEAFKNLWRSKKKAGRLNRRLKEAFEELVERRRLYEILTVEQGPTEARLTLLNLWRLTRAEGRRSLMLHAFDLNTGQWREQAPETIDWQESAGAYLSRNWSETSWPALEIGNYPFNSNTNNFNILHLSPSAFNAIFSN